jgi:hypothetical protein
MLEDEYPGDGVRFVVREYGILVVDGANACPGCFARAGFPPQQRPGPDEYRGRAQNPPAAKVDGTVKQVDAATGLVTISIGSDAGLEKGHTLEVYRLSPARYLGTLTVLEVQPTQAVGRVKGGKDAVQVGDRIASRLLGGS